MPPKLSSEAPAENSTEIKAGERIQVSLVLLGKNNWYQLLNSEQARSIYTKKRLLGYSYWGSLKPAQVSWVIADCTATGFFLLQLSFEVFMKQALEQYLLEK